MKQPFEHQRSTAIVSHPQREETHQAKHCGVRTSFATAAESLAISSAPLIFGRNPLREKELDGPRRCFTKVVQDAEGNTAPSTMALSFLCRTQHLKLDLTCKGHVYRDASFEKQSYLKSSLTIHEK
mmetsp:Transcript_33905/g.101139  ORF Transcript_33905/g.101139 Transcript_33905/m.101139 type:complete len:126 (+) Transcript_33905:258-635(+)